MVLQGPPPGKRVVPIYPMETPNGAANTVGGRFIPSGFFLAQDFTHEPACQTGERAPQGRFRHQPEQMVHPPFAWQLASFPSLPVCGEEAPYCPLRDFVTLRTYSLEIKAQQVLSTFLPVYPELAALVGATVPDYRGYFLRGVGGNSASLGEKQGDAIKHPTTESVLHFWKSFENCWATGVFSIPNQSEYDVTIKKSNSSHSFPRKLRFDLANAWESGYTAVETRPVNRAVRYLIRAR